MLSEFYGEDEVSMNPRRSFNDLNTATATLSRKVSEEMSTRHFINTVCHVMQLWLLESG